MFKALGKLGSSPATCFQVIKYTNKHHPCQVSLKALSTLACNTLSDHGTAKTSSRNGHAYSIQVVGSLVCSRGTSWMLFSILVVEEASGVGNGKQERIHERNHPSDLKAGFS